MNDQFEQPDWDYKESIKFQKLPDRHGQHWHRLEVRSLGLKGWTSLGMFNQTMIVDLLMNCHDALDENEAVESLEKLYHQKT
tara:strand:+ start:522 stop:767 length:246 start_codon:yes stop_codon:yes gene_type:complete